MGTATYTTREDILGSVRGRVGYSWSRFLVYVTGGAVFGHMQDTYSLYSISTGDTNSSFHVGWTVGGGLEYAINSYLSVRAEYRRSEYGAYKDFGAHDINIHRQSDNRVQAGFSFRFDTPPSGPLFARY